MTSLDRLELTIPNWVSSIGRSGHTIIVKAKALKPDGSETSEYELHIEQDDSSYITVREHAGMEILPCFCAERHINPGGTFCLHFEATRPIASDAKAAEWWTSLAMFLVNQDFATKRALWPPEAQLSHGVIAAAAQVAMERIADIRGWRAEVTEGIFLDEGWLSKAPPRVDKKTDLLVNGRAPCPRGCSYAKVKGSKTLVCENAAFIRSDSSLNKMVTRRDCPHKKVVAALAGLESERRKSEKTYYEAIHASGYKCCGTMKTCGLPKESAGPNFSAMKIDCAHI